MTNPTADGGAATKPSQDISAGKPNKLASAFSGALAGAVVSACVQPLDVLRTRMQADAAAGTLQGSTATLRMLLKEGGTRGMWRGTGPTVWRLSLGAGLHFTALDALKTAIEARRPGHKLTATDAFFVGGLSRALAATCLCPVTLVKTRMEYGGPGNVHYKNTLDAMSTIVRSEGPRGLFRGVVPTVITNAPFSALYYMFYKQLQSKLTQEGRSTLVVNSASGLIAATAATVLTQPTDGLRTRMQLGLSARGVGVAALFQQVVAQQGTRSLMAGVAPRIAKRTLQTALLWTLYEELRVIMVGLRQEH